MLATVFGDVGEYTKPVFVFSSFLCGIDSCIAVYSSVLLTAVYGVGRFTLLLQEVASLPVSFLFWARSARSLRLCGGVVVRRDAM